MTGTKQVTATEAEAIVRKVWERVEYRVENRDHPARDGGWVNHWIGADRGKISYLQLACTGDKKSAQLAALAFTREHMRKLAEKAEERAWVAARILGHDERCVRGGCKTFAIGSRILASIEYGLAILRRGVRPEYQDGRME